MQNPNGCRRTLRRGWLARALTSDMSSVVAVACTLTAPLPSLHTCTTLRTLSYHVPARQSTLSAAPSLLAMPTDVLAIAAAFGRATVRFDAARCGPGLRVSADSTRVEHASGSTWNTVGTDLHVHLR